MGRLRRRKLPPPASQAPSRDDYSKIFYPLVSVAVGGGFCPLAFPMTRSGTSFEVDGVTRYLSRWFERSDRRFTVLYEDKETVDKTRELW
ncbi:hypothetical protein Syun_015158 [Stephania yunnanensis]|uniref:Uncharacterized protein n=1 Tax=Stephania yunnanensis TaxID=152371 RepID=A0AAP0JMD7_9MAGN